MKTTKTGTPQKAHDKNAGIMMHCKSVPKLLSHHESRSSHILQLEVVFSLIQRTGFTTYYKKYSVSSPLMSLTAYRFPNLTLLWFSLFLLLVICSIRCGRALNCLRVILQKDFICFDLLSTSMTKPSTSSITHMATVRPGLDITQFYWLISLPSKERMGAKSLNNYYGMTWLSIRTGKHGNHQQENRPKLL